MVVTRSQARRRNIRPTRPNPRTGMRAMRWRKMYRPNDHAKRHRLPDRQPKTEEVVSYRRRK